MAASNFTSDLPKINFDILEGFKDAPAIMNKRSLIEYQLNPAIKDTTPSVKWDREINTSAASSEGTGTRGGGSGVLMLNGEGNEEVVLLDLYRARNRKQFPLFFETDSALVSINHSLNDVDLEAQEIYKVVLERIENVYPGMAHKLKEMEKIMPMSNWISTSSNFPLIEDFIGDIYLKENQQQVQIAYRRNNQIIFAKDLFNKMDGLNRAALKLHEYLYASASNGHSVSVQRLVSLLMSNKILDSNFKKSAGQTLFDLKLNGLAMEKVELLPGQKVTQEEPGFFDMCGTIKKFEVNPSNKSIMLQLSVNPKKLQLTRKDLKAENLNDRFFTKYMDKKLEGEDVRNFMLAIYSAKEFISTKYPTSLYPAQTTNLDIVCVNKVTFKLTYVEISQSIHKKRKDSELHSAKLEADYFQAQEVMSLHPSQENEKSFIDIERNIIFNNAENMRYKILSPLMYGESEELDGIRIKFMN